MRNRTIYACLMAQKAVLLPEEVGTIEGGEKILGCPPLTERYAFHLVKHYIKSLFTGIDANNIVK